MNKFILIFLGILNIFLLGCEKSKSQMAIKQELEEITSQLDTAWNNGDAIAFANLWSVDAINVSPMGKITEGIKEIETNMSIEFSTTMKGTTHKLIIANAYSVSPSVAVADGIAEVTMENHDPWKSQFTAVFSKDKNSNWKIVHMRAYVFLAFNKTINPSEFF
jgi:uncharacterized protein (TIGR02246 family)